MLALHHCVNFLVIHFKLKSNNDFLLDYDTKIKRITERDNISYQYAMNRINSQPKEEYLSTKSHYIVDNSQGKDIKKEIEKIIEDLQ